MFLWDNIGETRIRFDEVDAAGAGLSALLDACTVPIAVHDHRRAGILGTGTFLRCGERHVLLTAAHLFDGATSSGNWLIPERASGQLLSLEGARVRVVPGTDIAMVELGRTPALPRLLHGRCAIPARLVLRRRKQRAVSFCLAGYPAAWSRFERGYLAARRLTITTQRCDDRAGEVRCAYGHVAERHDGEFIHTPALEGMSGAAIWEVGRGHLHLAGVQSAFMHGRYLRGDVADACEPFFHT